jgi:two-component system, chemotaxis family, CheB/CheR fusion protein
MNDAPLPSASPLTGEKVQASASTFPVVGLGASAGGLKALLQFFEQMPNDNGMAFVVILHLSPKHESNAASVLQNATKMPVTQVTESTKIEPNHVYVIPPTKDLSMDDGMLRLSDSHRPAGRHIAIDLFFRTLATAHRERSFSIILSGTGSDGTAGITRVKEQGGITIAQSPAEAEYDAMPRSAIGTGMIDFVLPVTDMPQKLLQIWENARAIELPPADDLPKTVKLTESAQATQMAEEALREILLLLRTRTGHDFTHYKRATVLRRIERRLQVNHLKGLPEYRDYLRENPEETKDLLKDLLISVTNFFRDREAFETLEREVVPQILANKKTGEQIRVWVPGCASGEEAYSLAILLSEYIGAQPEKPEFQIFATDIDERAIAGARDGKYPESIVTDVPPVRLRTYFDKQADHYQVKKLVRERILFATHNLLKDPPFSRLDLISCRNLLIYLNREVQGEILALLHFTLQPGGFLFLGGSETADAAPDLFTPVDKKHRIYRANVVARAVLHMPHLPVGTVGGPYTLRTEASHEKRKVSFGELHQKLLEQYAPPSVIINHDYDIVHLSDRAGRFLQFAGGEPSHNLLKVVHPELRLDLRTALFQAVQTAKSVEARRVKIQRNDRDHYVNMIVRPVSDADTDSSFILVIFDEVEETMSPETGAAGNEITQPVMRQLEEELQRTKEQLQATIEQYETSIEEQKGSNEELQAINEEFRSTTEELETSKEELQSINEELSTVNQELKNKVDETGKVNNDLQNLIASTDIATIFVDRGMRINRYTPRALSLFNLIPTDVNRSLLDITHRLDYAELVQDTNEVLDHLRVIEREVQSADGRSYVARLLPYRTTEDHIAGVILTFIDITTRKQVERTMRAVEERFRLLVENAQEYAIYTLDTAGRIVSWTAGAERIFGYREDEIIGQSDEILFTPEDRAQGLPMVALQQARASGETKDERWYLRRDGTRLFCSEVLSALRDGDVWGYAKITRDRTEAKQMDAAREALLSSEIEVRTTAEQASRVKDEFLAVLSHELKHPLNRMQMTAEVLLRRHETANPAEIKQAAETVLQTIKTQAQIINDLLDLSRLNTGKLVLNRKPLSLVPLLKEMLPLASAQATEKEIVFEIELPEEPLIVDADAGRLEQIVWNLLSNALKFTPRGGQISVWLEYSPTEVELIVQDTGQGITAEFLPHVFDMFRQAESPATRQQGGLGVGLALVKELTELHGGQVAVTSEGAGKGACFIVTLPLLSETPASRPAPLMPREMIKGMHILVVDDDADSAELMCTLLQIEGAVAEAAANVAEALRLADIVDFELIISDIAMPGVNGYDLIQTLRQQPRYADVPAIALSGFGRMEDVQRALAAGFSAHLGKPVEFDKLLHLIRYNKWPMSPPPMVKRTQQVKHKSPIPIFVL